MRVYEKCIEEPMLCLSLMAVHAGLDQVFSKRVHLVPRERDRNEEEVRAHSTRISSRAFKSKFELLERINRTLNFKYYKC